ncbi:acylglycerol kinase, mitochondrial [Cloeon dipterum]|uniref:acylglycerol kinase, mitochondrial n=1 Tax=Cloeon dipterum TaxID=197152 RepID=UPI00322062CF
MKILTFFKTIRNNWKKSTFAACLAAYGVDYAIEKQKVKEMMRAYCLEAVALGQTSGDRPKRVTVILNPAANGRKAVKDFEKYCAPLLHLAGLTVSVVNSDNEGQIKGLMDVMDNTDCVVIAGGDGSLSEAVTGFLRRPDANSAAKKIPLGIIPLGATNQVAASIFGKYEKREQLMAEATKAVVEGNTKSVDVMKIEPKVENAETPAKPVYALGEIQWGAYRDAHVRRNRYWLYGPFRSYASMVFSWPKDELAWDCQAHIKYVKPCAGCSKCGGRHLAPETEPPKNRRWWHSFLSKPTNFEKKADFSKIINEECGVQHELDVNTADFSIASPNAVPTVQSTDSALQIALGRKEVGFTDFVKEGWNRVGGEAPEFQEIHTAQEVWFTPKIEEKEIKEETKEEETKAETYMRWLSIDHENFELMPMHITLQPSRLNIFCSRQKQM